MAHCSAKAGRVERLVALRRAFYTRIKAGSE